MSSPVASSSGTQQQQQPYDAFDRLFSPSIVCGLTNVGNTCFANSALQCVANLPTIVSALRFVCRFGAPNMRELGLDPPSSPSPPSRQGRSNDIVRYAVRTLASMEVDNPNGNLVLAPRELIRAVGDVNETFADYGSQQDAAEWLLHGVLDACNEYIGDRSIKASDISAAFAACGGGNNNNASRNGKSSSSSSSAVGAAKWVMGQSWSSHARFAVWKTMARVDDENAKIEYEEKKRAKNSSQQQVLPSFEHWKRTNYCSPYIFQSAALDSMRGTFLTEVKCHNCSHTSRTFSTFTSLELSFPTAAERAAYRDMVAARKKQQQDNNDSANSSSGNPSPSPSPPPPAVAAAAATGTTATGDNTDRHSVTSNSDSGSGSGGGSCGVNQSSSMFWKILFLPCAVIASVYRAFVRCCSSICSSVFLTEAEGPITLDELLWTYTRDRLLTGSNKYKCSKCQQTSTATLSIRFLELPHVLAIHLKRFESSQFGGLWTEKIPDFVEFPPAFDPTSAPEDWLKKLPSSQQLAPANIHLEAHRTIVADAGSPLSHNKAGKGTVLDLSPFLASPQQVLSSIDDANQNDSGRDGGSGGGGGGNVTTTTPWVVPQLSTFTLNSLINHHGGFGGGHYTAYARKPAEDAASKPVWALFNDNRAAQVTAEEVAQSQAYVLLYEKKALCVERPELVEKRRLARDYLIGRRRCATTTAAAGACTAVPRLWLFRVATLAEPGPLLHRAVASAEEARERSKQDPNYVQLAPDDFDELVATFGELRLSVS